MENGAPANFGGMLPDDRAGKIAAFRRQIAELDQKKAEAEGAMRQLEESEAQLVWRQSGVFPAPQTSAEKIALFLTLFGARRDVYPRYWENAATRKKGYSPAYDRSGGFDRDNKRYLPLTEAVVESHLRGREAIGIYALRPDDSCIFVAADFDGDGWKDNVHAYKTVAERSGIAVGVERSRSGNGAHAWIFFSEPVPAALARQMATTFLAKASAGRPTMNLTAYDRLFPNQDAMPKGGFGNLIALPLAGEPRKLGNTVFLDDGFNPVLDQWAFLAGLKRHSREDLDGVVGKITPMASLSPNTDQLAFALEKDECALDLSRPLIKHGMLTGDITVRLDSRLHVPRSVPASILAAIKRLATFANPVFHEKLRLRFSTHDTPRFIFPGEWHPDRLVMPRGAAEAAIELIESAGAIVQVQDSRPEGSRARWKFLGELRPEQEAAVRDLVKHDYSVLCAPPGAGKTVVGCALAARHKTATLVLVHRAILLDQWRNEAGRFLGLEKRKDIGIWRGSTRRLTRQFDIAMLPSLTRMEDYPALFEGYGLVIVDECHHVPAATFEALLKACPCRRIVGLTATPKRKDGLEKLLYLQCGPIRHTMRTAQGSTERVVFVRRSSFAMPDGEGDDASIHAVWEALCSDLGRTKQIAADVLAATADGRYPLVLSDRRAHLDRIAAELVASEGAPAVFLLESGMGKRQRQALRESIDRKIVAGERFVLLSTAALVGEGYDLPRLDTLFLAMPLSFKGRLVQYAGRLHREHAEKEVVQIYDYVDRGNRLTAAMFRRRSAAYRQMGYRIIADGDQSAGQLDLSPS